MERYSSYKHSGVQWLGEIPSHWKVVPFKNIANIILGKMLENAPEGQGDKYLCAKDVHMNSINYDDLKLMKFSPEEKKKYAIQKGDMLVVEGGASGSSAIVNKDVKNVYIQNSLMIVRCGENVAYNPFASYMLNSMVNRGYAESVCNKATIMHFTKEKLGATLIACPPLPEQKAITSYLDTVTSKIDTAIAQQQKMIDLLNERKQIIINNAVTKGLNPNVKMKDSGVDWIGEIPEEWEVKKAKLCVTINNGSDPKTEGNIPVYGSGASSFRTCGEYKEGPCVLIGRKGATLHIPHYIQGRYWNVDTAFDVKPKNGIQLKYYYYLATCFDYPYYMSQTTLPSMTSFDYNRMKLPLPPEAEQKDIIDKLEQKLFVFDNAISSIEKQISLLQERKQIIINEVVTGKVKVS